LKLKCDFLVSSLCAFKCNLYRYTSGWVGLNLFSAAFAAFALVFVVYFYTPVGDKRAAGAGPVVGAAGLGVVAGPGAVAGVGAAAGSEENGGGEIRRRRRREDDDDEEEVEHGRVATKEEEDVGSLKSTNNANEGAAVFMSSGVVVGKGSARAAFRSGAMVSHCYTAFSVGYQFMVGGCTSPESSLPMA
jgi:hypothetical protein